MSQLRDTSAPGQALEFEIWSDLIKQSHGSLHVFLPLLDRGLDAVLHRMPHRPMAESSGYTAGAAPAAKSASRVRAFAAETWLPLRS